MEQENKVDSTNFAGRYDLEIRRVDGTVEHFSDENLIVDEGLNHILNTQLNGSTQVTTWYLGVFEGNYTPLAGVDAATITASSTESTAYDAATRVEWNEAASTAKSITNSANRASFVFNASKTIYGAFLVSASAKSATSGTLFSAARFATAKQVDSGDELLLTYTVTSAST
jgi:hypothetical protein